jgi:hypothetical protein
MAKSHTRALTAAVTLLFVVSLPRESDAQYYGQASGTWNGYYSYFIEYTDLNNHVIASFSDYGIPTTLYVTFNNYGVPNSLANMYIGSAEFAAAGLFSGTFGARHVGGTITQFDPFGSDGGDLDANFVSILPSGLIDTTGSIAVAHIYSANFEANIDIGNYIGPGYILENASFGPQQFPEPSSVVLAATAACALACWACVRSLFCRRSRARAAQ